MMLKTTQKEMREIACEWIKKDEPMIVEVGCAAGNFAELLYKRGITNYTGIDILSKQIEKARKKLPQMNFVNCDITKNLNLLQVATTVVSFQCLEHIEKDISVVIAIPQGARVYFSVPNSPYRKEHKRWFEVDGWIDRYVPYIDFEETVTIQNPKKHNKRSFLFKGMRR